MRIIDRIYNFKPFQVAAVDLLPPETIRVRQNNSIFVAVCAFAAAWIGSLVSGMIYVAFGWALIRLAQKKFRLSADSGLNAASTAFSLFFLSSVVMNIVHFDGGANLFVLVQRAAFLALLPVASRLALSSRMSILQTLEAGSLAGAFIAMTYGLWDLASGMPRAYALSGNPGPFAHAGIIIFTVNLNAALRRNDPGKKLYALGAAFAAIAVFSAGLRAIWPILGLAALIVSFGQARLTKRDILAALLILAGAFALSWLVFGDLFQRRLLGLISDYNAHGFSPAPETSLGKRMAMLVCANEAIRAAPIFGLGDAGALSFLHSCTGRLIGSGLAFSHFHNFILNAWVKGGLPDVVAILATIAAPFYVSFRCADDEAGRSGRVILQTLSIAFGLSGMVGILFGHDIQDAVFVFFALCGLHLGSRSVPLSTQAPFLARTRS